jgi:phospholipid/cholesterol/gamma-HCH transport system substrate-binding protein
MNRSRSDLIRVGLFVVVAGSILVIGLLWIAGSRFFRPVATYVVKFDRSVTGLNAGANVEYQGVVVGRVRTIQLTPEIPPNVAVAIDVDPSTPVREDTQAALLGSLVTGIKYIELQGGSKEANPVPPGGTIRGVAPSLEQFRDRLNDIADRVTSILENLQKNVFTPQNSEKLARMLTDMGEIAESLNQSLQIFRNKKTAKEVAKLVGDLAEATDTVNKVMQDFYKRRDTIYVPLESTLKNLDATTQEARDLLKDAGSQIGGTGQSLSRLLADLVLATGRLQETLDVIRSDPSMLIRGRNIPKREYEQ